MARDERAARVLALHGLIMAAVRRGALTEDAAVRWARRAARGEDIRAGVSMLTDGTAPEQIRAHSGAQVANQIMTLLQPVLSGGWPAPEGTTDIERDPSLAQLWPPGVWDDGGPGHGTYSPEPPVYEDGKLMQPGAAENGATRYRPYASARERITDAEAAALFPPASWPPDESWVRARAAMETGRKPYTDEELHAHLFGDTTGTDAG